MATVSTTDALAAVRQLLAAGQDDGSITAARFLTYEESHLLTLLATALTAVDTGNITAGAVDRPALADAVINAAKLDDNAVTTGKVLDAAITLQKLATDARVAAWATRTGATGRMPQTQTYGPSVIGITISGNNLIFTTASGAQVTRALPTSGGSTPTPPATLYYGLSTDNDFSASEYTASASATSVLIPRPAGNRYLAFAVPDDAADITYISPNHATGDNQFSTFDRITGTITLGGVAHKAWRTDTIGSPNGINRTWYIQTG